MLIQLLKNRENGMVEGPWDRSTESASQNGMVEGPSDGSTKSRAKKGMVELCFIKGIGMVELLTPLMC